ncbi:MAG: methyltransferase domain-containing protein [Vicinamibacterales bacterium]
MSTSPLPSLSVEDTRAAFAEELRVVCGLKSAALVEAIARVPRDRFLGPGPWLLQGEYDAGRPRMTGSADPRLVHHNISVAIDPARMLFNGQPGLVATWIDGLDVQPGDRVVHVGCATGYYTALLAHLAGSAGSVTAFEVDPDLAARARTNLADLPVVEVRHGDGRTALPDAIDVLLVHAGATHLLDEWMDRMSDRGRLLVPLTCTMPGPPGTPGTLGKGTILRARRDAGGGWSASVGGLVMIYSLVDLRDESRNGAIGQALGALMRGGPAPVTRLRRDPHDAGPGCWLHGPICLSA